jgi:hypothetical protein
MGQSREPDINRECFQRFRIGHVAAMMVVMPTFLSVEARVIDCGYDGGALGADAADFHPPAGGSFRRRLQPIPRRFAGFKACTVAMGIAARHLPP